MTPEREAEIRDHESSRTALRELLWPVLSMIAEGLLEALDAERSGRGLAGTTTIEALQDVIRWADAEVDSRTGEGAGAAEILTSGDAQVIEHGEVETPTWMIGPMKEALAQTEETP